MLILGCDTSSIASGALIRVEDAAASGRPYAGPVEVLGAFRTEDTRSHAEVMAPGVEELLRAAGVEGPELGMVLTGVGPGPFTGLRAGIVTARTLAWAWGTQVRGVVSLDAVAEAAHDAARAAGHRILRVVTDARRREVYAADYEILEEGYRRAAGPAVGPAAEIGAALYPAAADGEPAEDAEPAPAAPSAEPPVAGRGALLYPESLTALPGHDAVQPTAEDLVRAALRAGLDAASTGTSPLYLRGSDARVPAPRKRALR
ncbi:tRNA (adenosine(37)-N6)-threonylcarbamoyltransferase complex dimerization subunit type 1 TsaB [Rothia sp. AR01]|uniref:tRNA (Adenosine(37)-N6)-threonylcarbamoyltransferase complex dimerization subunit type 1 TsaB n=1 Tax=Rothia santali TaxID=2949643 RepID=A0A9X2KKB6_9MICC|nr:tRNA (adenosine(37)-N6)-threonylcarbamoyltransferase complex dimerization subunit type 1 TsaB [Rothia santali]MCP3424886.1 tRNA (adenosine(37)-N6)-threonylcarbamoyltransferase complex dimerization subunit type 1 TsaB [Rothia santali]